MELETTRLKLRQWLPGDYAPFAALNADPQVMEYFPARLEEAESHVFAQKIESLITEKSWGLWAVELKSSRCFIGFVGLHQPGVDLPFTPCVEIGWRLAKEHWGRGYATEAATAALRFAFETLDLDEVVSFTSVLNERSQLVMTKLNMVNTLHNFDYPVVPVGHPLREHVLYKLTKTRWESGIEPG